LLKVAFVKGALSSFFQKSPLTVELMNGFALSGYPIVELSGDTIALTPISLASPFFIAFAV
jgi:hypothetical protein